MAGYTPLFSSIVTSSIWDEDSDTRVVWITMMALANADGFVESSIPGLARMAKVSLLACEKALNNFLQPDKYSRSKEYEGRRIKAVENGWILLNFHKHREKAKKRTAEYYRNYRRKQQTTHSKLHTTDYKLHTTDYIQQTGATQMQHGCNINVAQPLNKQYTKEEVKDACILNGIPESNAQSYFDQYNSQSWFKGNNQPITNLQSHMRKRWNKVKQCWDFDERKEPAAKKRAYQVEHGPDGLTPHDREIQRIENLKGRKNEKSPGKI